MPIKNIAILGSTGSIGMSTLEVVSDHPDRFRVVALAAGSNVDRLIAQAEKFRPQLVAIGNVAAAVHLKSALAGLPIHVACGSEGISAVAAYATADMTVSAIVGAAGLAPTLAAVRAGKEIALANKECLVMAGELFLQEIIRNKVGLIPVDSEHSAIFQALFSGSSSRSCIGLSPTQRDPISKLTLTASGGPFRGKRRAELTAVTPQQALAHPNWNMGRKISIDSATLMNKGLEVIEACHLFGVPPKQVDVVIHPESIVHSMVAFHDGSVLAQMGAPDMRTPIAVALAWPQRVTTQVPTLDLVQIGRLNFFGPPDPQAFPALGLAFYALEQGGGACAVLNAANEVAVGAFLDGAVGFLDIPNIIEWVLTKVSAPTPNAIEDVIHLDSESRVKAGEWVSKFGRRPS